MTRLLFPCAIIALACRPALAQTPSTSERSLFLLLPTGAQAVGMGQAMVAANPGSEAIWWNPASLREQKQKELAIHHSETIAGIGDAMTFVVPMRALGTTAFSLNLLDLGKQDVTDDAGNGLGTAFPRDVVFAGSYAIRLARRLTAGMNYKLIQLRVDCAGQCASVGPEVESSHAVDLGTQYHIEAGAPLTFGLAIRNLGGRLNSTEINRRTSLPTQVEAGALYRLKFIDQYVKDTEIRLAGSYVDSRSFGGKSVRLGTDVMYQGKVHLRAGFVGHDRRNDASAALGFGLQSGALGFDIAGTFGGLPAEGGQMPVYVSLRYLF